MRSQGKADRLSTGSGALAIKQTLMVKGRAGGLCPKRLEHMVGMQLFLAVNKCAPGDGYLCPPPDARVCRFLAGRSSGRL